MSAPETVLSKLKHLLKLAASSSEHEASTAQALADKLILKYEITEEELKSIQDAKPLYGEDDKLFVTFGIIGWKQGLALVIAKQFYCKIIQEEIVPVEGLHQFNYYVYGDLEDSNNVKFVYNTFSDRIETLIKEKCYGRGPVYISSYTEGVVEVIINTIAWEGIDIPNIKVPSREKAVSVPATSSSLAVPAQERQEKEQPCKETVAPEAGTIIKDVQAYFNGLNDGKHFSLQEVLELAAETQKLKELDPGSR